MDPHVAPHLHVLIVPSLVQMLDLVALIGRCPERLWGGGSLRFNVLFKKHNAESFSRTSCGSSVDRKINPFELR